VKFASFLEFLALAGSGDLQRDAAYKWYDLLWKASDRRLRRALADCGIRHAELSIALAELATRIRERGYEPVEATLRQYLLEWYVWRRINAGECRAWKYRR
jgi:hypothetical protein